MMPFEFLLKKKKGYKLIFAPLHVYVVELTLRSEFEHYLLLKCSNLVLLYKPFEIIVVTVEVAVVSAFCIRHGYIIITSNAEVSKIKLFFPYIAVKQNRKLREEQSLTNLANSAES